MGGNDVEDISKKENREKKRKKLEKELALAANTASKEREGYEPDASQFSDEDWNQQLKERWENEEKERKIIIEARERAKENYEGSKANLVEVHITLLLSIVGGMIGADRAYRGQIGLAFLKFITLGGVFLWYIADIWISAFDAMNSWNRYYVMKLLDEAKPDEEA